MWLIQWCLCLVAPKLASTNASAVEPDLPSSMKEKAKVSGTSLHAMPVGIAVPYRNSPLGLKCVLTKWMALGASVPTQSA